MLGSIESVLEDPSSRLPDYRSRLSTRTLMALEDIKRQRDDSRTTILSVLKEYFLVAVNNELVFEITDTPLFRAIAGEFRPTYIDNISSFYASASTNDVCAFFDRASLCFHDFNPCLYGGPAWSNIAKVSKQLWLAGNDDAIDHVIDVMHNGVHHFDKDPEFLSHLFLTQNVEHFLHHKRNTTSASGLLSRFQPHESDPADDLAYLEDRLDLLNRLSRTFHCDRSIPPNLCNRIASIISAEPVRTTTPKHKAPLPFAQP